MTVTVYRYDDASAPTLTNTAGSLITVLDACLVNGYGSKLAAGWSKPFSGTNKAVYKQPSGSNGFYLRVDDSATNYARVVGYETMTDVDTGTNPFPTDAQMSGGFYWLKTTYASKHWTLFTNGNLFYLWKLYDSSTNGQLVTFGDISSRLDTDIYNTVITGSRTTSNDLGQYGYNTSGYIYMPRDHTQTGSSVAYVSYSENSTFSGASAWTDSAPSSDIANKLVLLPIVIAGSNTTWRGNFQGLYTLYPKGIVTAYFDTVSVPGDTTYTALKLSISYANHFCCVANSGW